jgi:hypothetical protein
MSLWLYARKSFSFSQISVLVHLFATTESTDFQKLLSIIITIIIIIIVLQAFVKDSTSGDILLININQKYEYDDHKKHEDDIRDIYEDRTLWFYFNEKQNINSQIILVEIADQHWENQHKKQ